MAQVVRQMSKIEQVRIGNHIIAIYTNAMSAFDEAIEFLKRGIDQGECIMLITEAFTRDEVLDRMSKEWNIDARKLEEASDIIVKTTKQWYFPDGPPDSRRILAMWNAVVGLAILRNKKGLR